MRKRMRALLLRQNLGLISVGHRFHLWLLLNRDVVSSRAVPKISVIAFKRSVLELADTNLKSPDLFFVPLTFVFESLITLPDVLSEIVGSLLEAFNFCVLTDTVRAQCKLLLSNVALVEGIKRLKFVPQISNLVVFILRLRVEDNLQVLNFVHERSLFVVKHCLLVDSGLLLFLRSTLDILS